MGNERNVEVYWAENAREAHLVRSLLEEAGIQAHVIGEMLQAAAGELPLGPTSSPRVWVPETDRARAREIITEWEKQRGTGSGTPWECAACGESVEGNFDICWNCQGPKPPQTGPTERTEAPAVAAPAQKSEPLRHSWWWPSTTAGSAALVLALVAAWMVAATFWATSAGLLYAAQTYFWVMLLRAAYLKVSGKN
jgi:hypothetical protein